VDTFAEGLATKTGYDLPQAILGRLLDDFVLVNDDEIRGAMGMLVEKAHTLSEGAGAAALAGALKSKEILKGKNVSITISGANTTIPQLQQALKVYQGE
jgi:threonine dehydratase